MPSLYKLCDWINKEKLNWSFLAKNKYYIYLLLQIPPEIMWMLTDKINWQSLSSDPDAIELLEKNQNYINWNTICYNRSAKFIINKNKYKISDKKKIENEIIDPHDIFKRDAEEQYLKYNRPVDSDEQSNAVFITKRELLNYKAESSDGESIDSIFKSSSSTTEDIDNTYVALRYDNSSEDFEWMRISRNSKDINFLEQNLDKIHWYALSRNPNGIELLEKHTDKINWDELSKNTKAMHLLKKNQDESRRDGSVCKINWCYISQNPSIFELNYDFIKKRMSIIKEELISKAMHPKRIQLWLESGIDIEDI